MKKVLVTDTKTRSDVEALKEMARKLRIKLISVVGRIGSGHLGGSLSAVEALTALYFHFLRIDPGNPQWEERDRFILSKGHCTPLYYAILSERGFFPDSWLDRYDCLGSPLQGHPDMRKVPGIDMTTGSLGQGISSAVGMSLAGAYLQKDFRVFAMIGDGEFQEGQVWEALMYAGAHKLGNLICIMDHNKLQLASTIENGLPIAPLAEKWNAFGWHTIEIDGHDMEDVIHGIGEAIDYRKGPAAVISHSIKGKGITFMEQVVKWHSCVPSREEVVCALRELGASELEISPWTDT